VLVERILFGQDGFNNPSPEAGRGTAIGVQVDGIPETADIAGIETIGSIAAGVGGPCPVVLFRSELPLSFAPEYPAKYHRVCFLCCYCCCGYLLMLFRRSDTSQQTISPSIDRNKK
jgi:hypothetical protein